MPVMVECISISEMLKRTLELMSTIFQKSNDLNLYMSFERMECSELPFIITDR